MRTRNAFVALLVLAAAYSCRPDDQRTDTLDPQQGMQAREQMDPELLAHIDAGNASFREDDFQAALEHYRAATELDPSSGVAWFGVYMAEDALGNATEAEAALERARSAVPGATIMHPAEGDTTR